MARGLVRRIFDHAFSEGWLKKGDIVVDPFAGIFSTGIEGASRGCRVFGCELEIRFVELAQENIALHRRTWEACGDPLPTIVQGDSRKLCEVLGPVMADCVVSSPPFLDERAVAGRAEQPEMNHLGRVNAPDKQNNYGQTPGQLGAMKAGDVAAVIGADAIVSSPPYADQATNGKRDNRAANLEAAGIDSKAWLGERRCTIGRSEGYGATDGQLGAMKAGDVAAVIGSPPFADSLQNSVKESGLTFGNARYGHADKRTDEIQRTYGDSTANLGNMPPGSVAAACDLICSSPPYEGSFAGESSDDPAGSHGRKDGSGRYAAGALPARSYGSTPGNVGNMRGGSLDAVLKSVKLKADTQHTPQQQNSGGADGATDSSLGIPPSVPAVSLEDTQWQGIRLSGDASNVEPRLADVRYGAGHAATSTSANLSKDARSHQDTGKKLLPQNAESQCQTTGDRHISIGQVEATVGEDSVGGHNENSPATGTETSASNADLQAASRSTTKKKQSKRKASGTTACQTSKRSAPSATLLDTEISSVLPSAQSAEQCTSQEQEASAAPHNAEKKPRDEPKNDSTGSKPKRTPAPSAESSSDSLGADGSIAQSCASEQQGSRSTPNQCESDEPITFWKASIDILRQCMLILRPGGIAVFVCKDFVRAGKRVDFSQQWLTACEAVGFEPVEWIKASLVKQDSHPSLFGDDPVVKTTSRKSFFRRLAEAKGSPAIDHEDVIIVRKPKE